MKKAIEWFGKLPQNLMIISNSYDTDINIEFCKRTSKNYKLSNNEKSLLENAVNADLEDYTLLMNYNVYDLNWFRPWSNNVLIGTIAPFGNMSFGEIIEVAKSINVTVEIPKEYRGFATEDLEQAHLINNRIKGIISGDSDPAKNQFWKSFIPKQKALITKLFSIEKQTRNKKRDVNSI